ncbi:hypothetical protein E1B28_010467 [Marasmius oreades]|uniref:Uncharacterized protein n=1 Tax=Marasmius oreades TaxID=181124 RepID=A0A9P7RYC9_9AGAR|nr:uncharacterized protein E1B28_010467 [Marasmius oreades]KAG7091431.1 hypothetical protein E1B28_010467 [Marasmius oreades]
MDSDPSPAYSNAALRHVVDFESSPSESSSSIKSTDSTPLNASLSQTITQVYTSQPIPRGSIVPNPPDGRVPLRHNFGSFGERRGYGLSISIPPTHVLALSSSEWLPQTLAVKLPRRKKKTRKSQGITIVIERTE